jgi:hypothetical protein
VVSKILLEARAALGEVARSLMDALVAPLWVQATESTAAAALTHPTRRSIT